MEYINRLDFIWKQKLTEEHKEAQLTHEINTILIQNILPLQIGKHIFESFHAWINKVEIYKADFPL